MIEPLCIIFFLVAYAVLRKLRENRQRDHQSEPSTWLTILNSYLQKTSVNIFLQLLTGKLEICNNVEYENNSHFLMTANERIQYENTHSMNHLILIYIFLNDDFSGLNGSSI